MTPAFIFTWITGLSMTHYLGFDTWLIIKLFFVLLLTMYHFLCRKWLTDFANDSNKITSKFFKITNEIPAIFLIGLYIATNSGDKSSFNSDAVKGKLGR